MLGFVGGPDAFGGFGHHVQDELDFLVRIRVWGDDKYELANFTDDEPVPAITTLATQQQSQRVSSPTWEHDLRTELQAARVAHHDIKVPSARCGCGRTRSRWRNCCGRCSSRSVKLNMPSGTITTPVLKLVLEVRQIVARLNGIFALMGPT